MADEKEKKPKAPKGDKKKGAKVETGPVPTYKRTALPRLKTFYATNVIAAPLPRRLEAGE